MKRILLLLICTFLLAGKGFAQTAPSYSNSKSTYNVGEPGTTLWTVGKESMPTQLQAFQENLGQFDNTVNGWKVLYGCDYEGTRILFTDHGVIYTLTKVVDDKEGEEGKKEHAKKIVLDNVSMEWENANPNLTVDASGETPYVFGSIDYHHMGKGIDNIKGFKKVVYHNIYPGIDVEYTFHKDKGIKYAINVHPGAKATDVKMLYNGQQELSLNADGDVHITTSMGDIIDHAPLSYQHNKKIESSFNKLTSNEVAFSVQNIDPSTELVIDPWTVSPIVAGFLPSKTSMDGANNVYILGMSAGASYEQKYSTAGALLWTYSFTQFGSPGYVSDLAVDVAGLSFVPIPYPSLNTVGNYYGLVSLKTNGTLNYYYSTDPTPYGTIFEVWNLPYSCGYSELIEAGAPVALEEQVGVVNSVTGVVGGVTLNTTIGEIFTGCIAPNGNYYGLAANPDFSPTKGPGDNIVCYTVAAGTATFAWSKLTTYAWDDFQNKNPNGISTSGMAAGCSYLYSCDGLTLDQRDLTNGNIVNTVTMVGGANTTSVAPSGVAVDIQCGTVYAGSNNGVNIYTQTLGVITTNPTPAPVYDVAFNNGFVAACGGSVGSGFVTQFVGQTCPGLSITHQNGTCTLTDSASVSTPTFCVGPYTYLWTPGGYTTQTIKGVPSGTYTVNVGTVGSCVTASDTVTISNLSPITVTATTSAAAGCAGNASATVIGGTPAYTYLWSSGQTTSAINSVSAGTYTITVTDSKGCSGSATVTIAPTTGPTATVAQTNVVCFGGNSGKITITVAGGTAPYTYSWSSGQTTSAITGIPAGTYICTITDKAGCVISETVIITQPAEIRDSLVSQINDSCFGENIGNFVVGVKGGAAPLAYLWTPSGGAAPTASNLTAGSYTLTITDANGCVQKYNGTITQPTQLTSTVSANVSMCAGLSTTLIGSATGGVPPYTYTWNGTSTSPTYTVSPTTTTVYTLQVTDANGCKAAPATVTVTISPSPTVAFTPNVTQGCYPLCVSFTDGTTPVGTIKNWYWQFGNGDTSTAQNPMECYNTAGTFSVTLNVLSTTGCPAKLTMPNLITTFDHPHAAFAAAPQPVDILLPLVQFTDKTVDYYGLQSWFWTFGDASDSTSSFPNPYHIYGDTGTFCPTLVVTNIHQCSDSVEQCIIVDPHFTLYIPNGFTPNGDNKDDIFLPTGVYICSMEMWIFDRWGMQIFHTTDMYKGWNGAVNSSSTLAQQDTYVYVIDATDCLKHTKHHYIGSVTLIK
jgi:gliding motility-associated-like protein